MSSETSTKSLEPNRHREPHDTLHPWQLFTLAGLIGATIVVFAARGQSPAAVIILSFTIFTAAGLGVAAWRTFAPVAGEDATVIRQIMGGRTRAALEREKTLVLRAIKDLEFDRAMGKVSDKDFGEMSGRLRVRAAGLLRQLDAGAGYRVQIEEALASRLGHPPVGLDAPAAPPSTSRGCSRCETSNEADARFCKQCGTALT